MSAASTSDQIARYFGGQYDPVTHTYRSPQIYPQGIIVGAIRRARPKRLDAADYFLGQFGAPVGSQIYIRLSSGREIRTGLGGSLYGEKQVRHDVTMNCLLRGDSGYPEDVQDGMYALLDTIRSYIHSDRTLGTGGIENNGIMVGEGSPWITWTMSDVISTAEESKALLRVMFSADEFIQA